MKYALNCEWAGCTYDADVLLFRDRLCGHRDDCRDPIRSCRVHADDKPPGAQSPTWTRCETCLQNGPIIISSHVSIPRPKDQK